MYASVNTSADRHINFETAQLVFDDPGCVTCIERVTDGEAAIIILLVVHAYREEAAEEVIRIVSARPAIRERKLYAQAVG